VNLQPTAVLLFDLDHFKLVNDRHGHAIGDKALQLFAETATAYIGKAGLVGRWGGDEFIAVLYDTARDRAATLAERIQADFAKAAAEIDGRPANTTVSTGMVFSAQGSFELPALLLQADQALYRAKTDGRNRLAVVDAAFAVPADAPRCDTVVDAETSAATSAAPLKHRSAA
jgi:diguanylate cyclase (GGDEF)-like protein